MNRVLRRVEVVPRPSVPVRSRNADAYMALREKELAELSGVKSFPVGAALKAYSAAKPTRSLLLPRRLRKGRARITLALFA